MFILNKDCCVSETSTKYSEIIDNMIYLLKDCDDKYKDNQDGGFVYTPECNLFVDEAEKKGWAVRWSQLTDYCEYGILHFGLVLEKVKTESITNCVSHYRLSIVTVIDDDESEPVKPLDKLCIYEVCTIDISRVWYGKTVLNTLQTTLKRINN